MTFQTTHNGAKCERKILAYKKNKPGLITTVYTCIIYIKNSNEEYFMGLRLMHITFYSYFDRLIVTHHAHAHHVLFVF